MRWAARSVSELVARYAASRAGRTFCGATAVIVLTLLITGCGSSSHNGVETPAQARADAKAILLDYQLNPLPRQPHAAADRAKP